MARATKYAEYDEPEFAPVPAHPTYPYSPASEGRTRLFDIELKTVIGTVYATPGADMSPKAVAFLTICDYGKDGEFTFPNEDGSTVHVAIYTEEVPGKTL